MTRVTREDLEHVAALARLSLTEEERATFLPQLERILDYAESLQSLDVEGVEPMTRAGEGAPLREDAPAPELDRERALGLAPDAADGLFRVPRVLGG